jgi:hypothetical protein
MNTGQARAEEIRQKRVTGLIKARAAAKEKRAAKNLAVMTAEKNDLPEGLPQKKSGTRTFIYRPQDPADPIEMSMGGIMFHANVPKDVADTVTVLQLITETRETAEGEVRSKGREQKVPLYKVLEHNPWFEIDGVKPPRPQPATARVPDTSDEYRGYAIAWIATSTSAATMDKRWSGEDMLRRKCGISASDLAYIMPFFDARREECADIQSQRVA